MGEQLGWRLKTLGEMKLMDMDVTEYLDELIAEYGEAKIRLKINELGIASLFPEIEQEEKT